MYDKETLLASVDCIELARYLGMPIEKHGSSYFTQCVSGLHRETQLDHNKIYSNGCYCFSCGKRYDAAGMVMAYYENVLGQSINFQEALGIIGDSLGGRNAFLVGKHVQFSPFPLTDEELQAIGLQPKAGSGKVIESAETDEDGNKLESSEACKIEGNGTKCQITPTQKTAYAVIENQLLIPGDDFLNTLHNLTVTKNVTLDGEQISEKYSGTFYVSLFTDPYYTNRTGDVKELQIQNGKSTSVSFTDLADGTYYVAETDKDGNPVENTDFGFDVSYDGDITVSFTEQNTDSTLAITNDMTERNPEYKKYSKKEDDGDDGKEKKKTSTSKNNSSNKTTKKGKNSKTGDNSHILFYAALAAAALAAGSAEVYRRRRRATGRNKHDR